MKISEVIEKVLAYHPQFPADYDGCDGYKFGDGEQECTGIACALAPTVSVIRRAHEAGCNLLFVHEPTNFTSPDEPGWTMGFENKVWEAKAKLLEEYGMTIWRDHDHMHAHQPDSIFTGVIKYLGWEEYYRPEDTNMLMGYVFEMPETTVGALAEELMSKLPMNGVRIVGDTDAKVRRVAIVGHLLTDFGPPRQENDPNWHEYATDVIHGMENGIDVIIPGEVVEWTALSYVRDAVALGFTKAVINIGHFSMEELGMPFARDWMKELVGDEVPVTYIPGEDIYNFLLKD